MAIYSTNQVRHVYVADGKYSCTEYPDGSFKLFFENAKGETVATDLITNVEYVKLTPTNNLAPFIKGHMLMLNPEVNGGAPVAGQDYIVKIIINNFASLGGESKYIKTVAVRATKGMDAEKFYTALGDAIDRSFSREEIPFITADPWKPEGKVTGIALSAAIQPWELGVKPVTVTDFDVVVSPITFNGEEVDAPFADTYESTNGDGEKILWPAVQYWRSNDAEVVNMILADLEYFSLGSRGDVYRNMGWPYVRPSKGMVNLNGSYESVLDIHYSYVGSNESVQKSEKDITIIIPTGSDFMDYLPEVISKVISNKITN